MRSAIPDCEVRERAGKVLVPNALLPVQSPTSAITWGSMPSTSDEASGAGSCRAVRRRFPDERPWATKPHRSRLQSHDRESMIG